MIFGDTLGIFFNMLEIQDIIYAVLFSTVMKTKHVQKLDVNKWNIRLLIEQKNQVEFSHFPIQFCVKGLDPTGNFIDEWSASYVWIYELSFTW